MGFLGGVCPYMPSVFPGSAAELLLPGAPRPGPTSVFGADCPGLATPGFLVALCPLAPRQALQRSRPLIGLFLALRLQAGTGTQMEVPDCPKLTQGLLTILPHSTPLTLQGLVALLFLTAVAGLAVTLGEDYGPFRDRESEGLRPPMFYTNPVLFAASWVR